MNEIISEHELHVFFSSLWLIISFLYCGIVTQWHCVGNIKPYIHNGRCFRHNAIQIRRYGIMSETTSIMDIWLNKSDGMALCRKQRPLWIYGLMFPT